MGAVREWFDVVGGVRSGLKDEPPWWAPAAIAVFGALVVGVLAVSLVFGVDGGGSPESARLRAAAAAGAPADGAGDETAEAEAGAGLDGRDPRGPARRSPSPTGAGRSSRSRGRP